MMKSRLMGAARACMQKILYVAPIGFMLMFDSMAVQAIPVFSTGAGTAVTSTDFAANFDTLIVSGTSLFNYQEGGLTFNPITSGSVSCPGGGLCSNHIGFQGMSGGIYYHIAEGAIVTTSNNESLRAFEVMVGTGFAESILHGVWETFVSGVSTGSGTFDVSVGTIVGITDTAGFDELRIGTYLSTCANTTFGSCETATALDFASAQLLTTVPVPAAVWLFGSGLLGLVGIARRKKAV